MATPGKWQWIYSSTTSWKNWELKQLLEYRDLLAQFVLRDFKANYQQTVLGPLWVIIQPAFTTIVYWVIFHRIVLIDTNGIPPLLFYLPGIVLWSFFYDTINGSMYTFIQNNNVFNKVYFPRLLVPFSVLISQGIRMLVQTGVFLLILVFFAITKGGISIHLNALLIIPILVMAGLFGLGAGLIGSVVISKYRDLDYTAQFFLRLFMFANPIMYPASLVPEEYKAYYFLNPLAVYIESFRTLLFTQHAPDWQALLIACLITFLVLATGISLFKKMEKRIPDYV